jgi:hypothetical protein
MGREVWGQEPVVNAALVAVMGRPAGSPQVHQADGGIRIHLCPPLRGVGWQQGVKQAGTLTNSRHRQGPQSGGDDGQQKGSRQAGSALVLLGVLVEGSYGTSTQPCTAGAHVAS